MGRRRGNTLSDKPNPINAYGKSKYLGELNVIKSGVDYLIIKQVGFSEFGANFLKSILDRFDQRSH